MLKQCPTNMSLKVFLIFVVDLAAVVVFSEGFNRSDGQHGGAGTDASGGTSGGGRGHGSGRFANFQSQVCFKCGHTASACHFFVLMQIINQTHLLCSMIPHLRATVPHSQNSSNSGQQTCAGHSQERN